MSTNYTPNSNSSAQTADLPPTTTITGAGGHPNVSDTERVISGVAGAVLAAYALTQTKNTLGTALPLGMLGGYLLYRGATGNCPAYTALRTGTGQQTDSKIAVIPEGQGIKVVKHVTIQKGADELYDFWRDFTNLPQFMNHLESVEITGEKTSKWTAKAPLGQSVTWNAEIINEKPGELIAWRSIEPADIPNAGSVRFEPQSEGRGTVVAVSLEYNPPLGMIGAAVARLFGEAPSNQVEDDLRRFQALMETGEIPTIAGQPQTVLAQSPA